MNREQFFEKLAGLSEDGLRKVLWNLYWRGSAPVRERIEAELDPEQSNRRKRPPLDPVDPALVLESVRDFAALARSGAYLAGDRRVSPRERTRWRFTFQQLVKQSQSALQAENAGPGAAAVEELIDLAREMHGYEYFRSDDPVDAARFVVSEAAALLWGTVRARDGFAGFAGFAAPQLIRWESRHGWTRRGDGRVSERETSLASVVAAMLPTPDTWVGFTDRYLDALDEVAAVGAVTSRHIRRHPNREREERATALAEWHLLLLHRLADYEAEDRLDRLIDHPALAGPELTFLQARALHRRGELERARTLAYQSLEILPGHRSLLDFAIEIGAPLPARAQQIAARR